VFADCDPETYTLDPASSEAVITERTKAIIPVHLFGQAADMDAFTALGKRYGISIVEDASQAHGAEYKGRRVGSFGEAGCFSLYPGKNLGAYGDAGIVVSNNQELMDRIKLLRYHGSVRKYEHVVLGWNARMDGLQGAILSVKLRYLDQANELRWKHAALYSALLSDCPDLQLPIERSDCKHVYHIYAIGTDHRDALLTALPERGIGCGVHYPTALHLQPVYAYLGKGPGAFPNAERAAARCLSLPMFPELRDEQIRVVASAIHEVVGQISASGRVYRPELV
jgi:dTDP-4-amino-4,6-dideoxygalactose transaminase